jgi:flagellin
MALSINTNIGALMAASSASNASRSLEKAMERLSTGNRINTASDDAAGMAISSRLTSEIRGTNQAIRNAMDGQALIDTAEGASIEIANILQRMRELAVQSANDTNSSEDRANLQLEVDQLGTEINRIAQSTAWAGKNLLNGTSGTALATSTSDKASFNLQIGATTDVGNAITVNIGAMTTQALGIAGNNGSVPALSNLSVSTSANDPALGLLTTEGNTISLIGPWTAADVYTVDINDTTVTITLSASDSYSDDEVGFSAQLKDQILASSVLSQYISVTDNGDGSVSLSQSATPLISNLATEDNGSIANEGISVSGGTITFSGNVEDEDEWTFNVNGVAVTVAADDADGFDETLQGLGALAKKTIEATVGLKGVVSVKDNGDGSITLSQATTPKIDEINKSTGTEADPRLEYSSSAKTLTFTNAIYEEGAVYKSTINGTEVSITAVSDDGFADSVTGLASQFTQAINAAGIDGVTATFSSGVVTLVPEIEISDALIVNDEGVAETSLVSTSGDQTSATLTLTSTDDLMEVGDKISFKVQGHQFEMTVGDDGFTNTLDGIAEQMKATVDAAGLTGVTVVASATSTTAVITVTNVPVVTGTGTGGEGPSVSLEDGALTLGGNVASGDEISFDLDGTSVSVTAYNSSLSDTASLLVSAINEQSGGAIVASLNDDGSIALSNTAGSASVLSTDAAVAAIDNIDAALEKLNSQRAELGAVSNRLDSTVSNLTNVSTNLESGRSRIQDADFAAESGNLAKSQILQQAATAMLAQANASKQGVLSLLQG